MDNVALWPAEKRSELVSETAVRRGMRPAIVEKDFWVCLTLGRLFGYPQLSKIILFKGGTSLAKVFHLIERFSEDIDLILDWRMVTSENPITNMTANQQDILNKRINKSAQTCSGMHQPFRSPTDKPSNTVNHEPFLLFFDICA